MSLQSFDERTVLNGNRRVLPADGTTSVSVVAVNSSDRRIDTILVANRDTIAHVVTLTKVNGAITTTLGSLSIPAGTGYAGTPSIDLLAGCVPATQIGINLNPADTLAVTLAVAVQATFDLDVTTLGGVF